jgi:hypothetical protein
MWQLPSCCLFFPIRVGRLTPFPQHWHGLFQQHTNYADGPAFVTQCPIIPGNSFLYEFEAVNQAVSEFRCHADSGASSFVSYRGRTGTTATSKISIVMACAVLWLSMTRRIPISSSMTSMMVSVRSTDNMYCTHRLPTDTTVITLADW